MNRFIDIYCERTMPGFWDEPLNALTNLSFFLAAFLAWRLARREQALDGNAAALIILTAVIGTGSFLFHTLAVLWAMLADTIPILFYQIVFISVYAHRVMGLACLRSSVLLGLFLLLTYGFGALPDDWLNGSLSYGPALIFLFGFAIWHVRSAPRERWTMMIAAGVFVLSLTFRSLDMAVCAALPAGVHYLWHILNGVVLYLTTRSYILNAGRKI